MDTVAAVMLLLAAMVVAGIGGVVYHWLNFREADRAHAEALRIKPAPPKG